MTRRTQFLALLATSILLTAASSPSERVFEKLLIDDETATNGIYDPALEYSQDGSVGWLAYSAVYGVHSTPAQRIDTHLAMTTNRGRTWTYVSTVNRSTPDTVTLPNGVELAGFWHYEVPTIVRDPDDYGREWKLFAHRFFWADGQRIPAIGWITYKYASDPSGPWSEEVALFGAGDFPPPPYNFQRYRLNELHPDLANHLAYSEPGTVVTQGALYLSLNALLADGSDRMVLLVSLDRQSWSYVGTLVDRNDARALGDRMLSGSSFFKRGGKLFMLATPIDAASRPDLHNNGTYVLAVEDITQAQLKRDDLGKLDVLLHIPPQDLDSGNHGAGQATYHRFNRHGGILFPQINLGELPEFAQIFRTQIHPGRPPRR